MSITINTSSGSTTVTSPTEIIAKATAPTEITVTPTHPSKIQIEAKLNARPLRL
jgi:hypothetical protein